MIRTSITTALATVLCVPAMAGLTRHDVLVLASSASPASQAVAAYYASVRGIPSSHVRLVTPGPTWTTDYMLPSDMAALRDQVKAHLLSLGSIPGQPETDPIKAIVICTDIPHLVTDFAETYGALDSTLSALFSESSWGKEPIGVYGHYQPAPGAPNAYSGDHYPASSFEAFRSDIAGSTQYEAFPTPGFTIVRLLDANTALAAGGAGIVYRGTASGGSGWTWSVVPGRNRAFIGWKVSDIWVLDSTHAYACTGNLPKPQGGGTIIATSDGGLTWNRIRFAPKTGLRLRDALTGVSFSSTSNGWAVGSSALYQQSPTPLMIRTTNGGSSWQDISAMLPASFYPRDVAAADASNVWICGAGGAIYRSTDGGSTWTLANAGAPSVDYNQIWIRLDGGSYKGWAAGDSGTIVRTENGVTWSVEAAGLTTRDITDLSVLDQDHACASYGQDSFLLFVRGAGWSVESMPLAPVISAAATSATSGVAVGGTRYIFGDSAAGWYAAYTGADTPWRLRYLVMRLDGYSDDVDPADGIPDDIKAIVDRAAAAASPGKFVIDEYPGYPNSFLNTYDATVAVVGSSQVVYDDTSAYLTRQSGVIGSTSWGSNDPNANNYTTWARALHQWVNGGIATFFVSSDGRSLKRPYYLSALTPGGAVTAGKLTVTGLPASSQYGSHRLVLHSAAGAELASALFSGGSAQIDLSAVAWPADHNTYAQIHFPLNDPLHPSQPIYHGRYPDSGSNTLIYDNRTSGYSLAVTYGQSLVAETLREGASGAIANVAEPWSSYAGQSEYLFPRYAQGFTWGETAYMGLAGIGWQEVAIGDPLMAPFATPPWVSITYPSSDGQLVSGTITFSASASAVAAPGISRVELWLDDDTLLCSDTAPPYSTSLDTIARSLPDGVHALEATAFESGTVQNTGTATRKIVVNNQHPLLPTIASALSKSDGTRLALQEKTVSAAFSGFFYIEESNRARGIKVRSSTPVAVGQKATVLGTMQTVNGEREIAASAVYVP